MDRALLSKRSQTDEIPPRQQTPPLVEAIQNCENSQKENRISFLIPIAHKLSVELRVLPISEARDLRAGRLLRKKYDLAISVA